jgi:glyceraldehyde-3-phosphate dehydrogenase (NADP+)
LILKKRNNIKKKEKMNAIPEEFQIKTLLNQDTYLVDGELKRSKTSGVLNDFFKDEYEPYGIYSIYGRKEGLEAVDAADAAFNNGQGVWPTMKVADR